ncbi:MAG: ribosome-associated translation inhibitor RaiA [Bacteroidia bacterium]|nr:ribosome-associated translation inhibitor RaiA [Bacteroidia bacterium]
MNIKIHSVHFDADKKLEETIQEKIQKLIKFSDNIIGAEVILRLANTHTPDNKIVEARLEIPGNDLFTKKQSATFEAAFDAAVDALRRQITKHKEKQRGL